MSLITGWLSVQYSAYTIRNMVYGVDMKRPWIWLMVLSLVTVLFFYCRENIQTVETSGAVSNIGRKTAEIIAGKGMLDLVRDSMEHPVVALTFDDGPSRKYTPLLLDGLKERGVKVSFFLVGKNIKENSDLIRRMEEEGHLIGNHTYNHVQLDKISDALAREEILKTNNAIYEVTGRYPQYMRPPYGAWKKNMEICVEMLPVFWTIDTLDWKTKDVQAVCQVVEKEMEDGAIILMHDEYETTVNAALKIVDEYQEKGYEFVTVDRLILP